MFREWGRFVDDGICSKRISSGINCVETIWADNKVQIEILTITHIYIDS